MAGAETLSDGTGQRPAPPAWRTVEYFASTRVIIASALVLAVAAAGGRFGSAGSVGAVPFFGLTLLYFALAAGFAVLALYVHRRVVAQVVAQLALDLAMISALVYAAGGIASGLVILYLLPIAGASMLLTPVMAFFACALATLFVLVDSVLRTVRPDGNEGLVYQAGLYGAALFAVTALLRLLTGRLARQEQLAQQRGRDLQNQLEINRLVIAQMEQGIVVVDAQARVRANNRTARRMLGVGEEGQLTGHSLTAIAGARELARAFLSWEGSAHREGAWAAAAPADGPAEHALHEQRLRARFVRPALAASDEFLIFLEDIDAVEGRARQLKLAAMGRLTASIAHEIRNPLAAISHAGELLAEEATDPVQRRMTEIVRLNTQRLNRLVEDVLRVARREPPEGEQIELARFIGEWLAEFLRDRKQAPDALVLHAPVAVEVRFEASHLRQVLYNLADNALRHGSGAAAAAEMLLDADPAGGRPALWVFDDGAGVPAAISSAVFEPFFTTHARGTGLGLYLAREFCESNGAELSYGARRAADGSTRAGFVLRFGVQPVQAEGMLDTLRHDEPLDFR